MEKEENQLLKYLNDEQRVACIENRNVLLKACPGSGKTRTLTYKLAYLAVKNSNSYKKNIAITYTNRAAEEIKDRVSKLNIDTNTIWTGTIHQFCLEYIIRPYSMYSDFTKRGYEIIDDYIQKKYIKDICGILHISFNNNENFLENSKVYNCYRKLLNDKKQIDFNMILEIAYNILNEKDFVSENIANIIGSIFIDEYQDTNIWQYKILEKLYLKNKRINLFLVGDLNQAIYGELGGIAKNKQELEEMYNSEFIELELKGCYRSTQNIIDFYKKFQIEPCNVESYCELSNEKSVIEYNKTIEKEELYDAIAKIIKKEIDIGTKEEEICVIAPQWWLLFDISNKLKKLLPNIKFNSPEINPIKYDPLNIYYLIARLLFTEKGKNTIIRKNIAREIINILKNDYKIDLPNFVDVYFVLKTINSTNRSVKDGVMILKDSIENLFINCKINIEEEENLKEKFKKFMENTLDRIRRYNLNKDIESFENAFNIKGGIVINTFHGVKGKEYKVVIAFGLLNGYIPNWNLIYNKANIRSFETKKLLYVVCSRAKQKLYLFSERGRTTRNETKMKPTDELSLEKF